MARVVELTVRIDLDGDLGAQLGPARQVLGWKLLSHLTGYSREGLRKSMASAGRWAPDVVRMGPAEGNNREVGIFADDAGKIEA